MLGYMLEHGGELLAIASGIVTVASMVAALTPTPKDDSVIARLRKLVDVLALNIGNAAKS